jgi:hypothetical protein
MDFDTAYNVPIIMGPMPSQYAPKCNAPTCFIGSYAPITYAGDVGPFWVNTFFLQPNRRKEIAGPVTFTASMWDSMCRK